MEQKQGASSLRADRATHEPNPQAVSAVPVGIASADNGCACRLCTYNREYDAMIALVPEPARAFFADMYERYENADFDREWARAVMDGEEWQDFDRHRRARD